MRHSFFTTLVVASAGSLVSAAAVPLPSLAPALDLTKFTEVQPWDLSKITQNINRTEITPDDVPEGGARMGLMATCSNPQVRVEWDSYNNKAGYVNAIKCLMGKPASGAYRYSKSKYEDLVALHQSLTDNVHENSKFLLWHRYYLWTFQDVLRSECGFSGPIPWFDETKYAGRFSQSSIFTSQYYGGIALGGQCVKDGKFAGTTLNVGPGTGNGAHCLARNGDGAKTANSNSAGLNGCLANGNYASFAACLEGYHAWGHNGVGAVMQDPYASPGDPFFFLHHAFIDRNFRIWQNANSNRVNTVNGNDAFGTPLTLSMQVNVNNIRPTVTIGDILDTLGTKLCYKYNY